MTPRYDQITINQEDKQNKLLQVLSPNPDDEGVWVHQDAWFHLGTFSVDKQTEYKIKKPGNGVYAFILSGSFTIEGNRLENRDGLGIWDTDGFSITSNAEGSEVLLMEVPMR